jgi:hypothetical protein
MSSIIEKSMRSCYNAKPSFSEVSERRAHRCSKAFLAAYSSLPSEYAQLIFDNRYINE